MAVVALAASGLVTAGAASAAPSVEPGPGGYTPSPVAWSKCEPKRFPKNFECGAVAVPLDWNDIRGTTITLAVTRVKYTIKRYQGVLLVNPGGPGGSGTILPVLKDRVPKGGGDSYDWIGFDPRGVGDTKPALGCITDYFAGPRPPYEPTTKTIEKAWITRAKAYAAACKAKNGALLAHITTEDTVKDIDAIRVALGRDQINYLGYSYGTSLGQTYGTLFPTHLRRAIFDSNVDPRSDLYHANFDQDVAFEKTFRVFAGWVARYDRVYHLGKTAAAVENALITARNRLEKKPVGKIGGDEFSDSLLAAGYYESTWPGVAKGASAWIIRRDVKALKSLYNDFGAEPQDNGYSVYVATTCNESNWPSYSIYRSDSWRYSRVAPIETWGNSWYNGACIYWPLPRIAPVDIDGSKVESALLIDETLDAATPYAGSLETRRRFPNAVLLAEPGGATHAGSLGGNTCVDGAIAAYLKHGTLPKRKPTNGADAVCAPLPPPKPGKASGGSGSGDSKASQYLLKSGLLR